jgi:hypothetical protein
MLEIREQILALAKERTKLLLTEEKALFYEVIEYVENEFIYAGGNGITNKEEFRYSLSPKQALTKICDHYRKKGNIEANPGYKKIYKYMIENP